MFLILNHYTELSIPTAHTVGPLAWILLSMIWQRQLSGQTNRQKSGTSHCLESKGAYWIITRPALMISTTRVQKTIYFFPPLCFSPKFTPTILKISTFFLPIYHHTSYIHSPKILARTQSIQNSYNMTFSNLTPDTII